MAGSNLVALQHFLKEKDTSKTESKNFHDAVYKIASARRYFINEKMSFLNELVWSDGTKYEF